MEIKIIKLVIWILSFSFFYTAKARKIFNKNYLLNFIVVFFFLDLNNFSVRLSYPDIFPIKGSKACLGPARI